MKIGVPSNLRLGKETAVGEVVEEVLSGVGCENIVDARVREGSQNGDCEEQQIFRHRISDYEKISD